MVSSRWEFVVILQYDTKVVLVDKPVTLDTAEAVQHQESLPSIYEVGLPDIIEHVVRWRFLLRQRVSADSIFPVVTHESALIPIKLTKEY